MSNTDIATRRSNLCAEQRALLEKRLRGKPRVTSETQAIRKRLEQGPAPLSFFQERMWFSDRVEPSSAIHNAPSALRLEGQLNVAALEQALSEIVRRHEALRTTFSTKEGQPVQVIVPTKPVTLSVVKLGELAESERDAKVEWLAREEARRSFDLSVSPLLRAILLRLGVEDHVLLLTFHHLTFDGWSKGVLIRELIALYEAFSVGKPSPLPELPIQYADYAVWQRAWLQGGVLERQLTYWKQRLDGASILDLPTDRPRPEVQTFDGERHWFVISEELSQGLCDLAHKEGATLFMVLLTAFNILLSRYARQEDVVVGTHVAGRTRAETEGLIGFFVNMLALRTNISGDLTFRELLAQVQEVTLGAYEHQEVPFEKVVEALGVKRDPSRSPLFQVMFAFHNAPRPPIKVAGLAQSIVKFDDRLVRFDLEFDLWRASEGLEGFLVYNTDLFDASTMQRMVGHYDSLLQGIVADPSARLSKLPPTPRGGR